MKHERAEGVYKYMSIDNERHNLCLTRKKTLKLIREVIRLDYVFEAHSYSEIILQETTCLLVIFVFNSL